MYAVNTKTHLRIYTENSTIVGFENKYNHVTWNKEAHHEIEETSRKFRNFYKYIYHYLSKTGNQNVKVKWIYLISYSEARIGKLYKK